MAGSGTGISAGKRAQQSRARSRRLPYLDIPKVEDPALARAFDTIAEHFRVYDGESNAPRERFVTLQELVDAGLVSANTKGGHSYIAQILNQDVSQKAGSTANPTLKGTVLKDTALGARTPGGAGGSNNPIEQGKRGLINKLSDIGNVRVQSPAQRDFLYNDGGKWINYPLFKRANRWDAKQNFAAGVSVDGTDLDLSTYLTTSSSPTLTGAWDFTGGFSIDATAITAADAGNWDTAYGWGDHASGGYQSALTFNESGDWFGGYIPVVSGTGVIEVGKYLDWHETDAGVSDYDFRMNLVSGVIQCTGGFTATTYNGYALSSAATGPPGASQIVKTHTNGYTYLGWINTVSGATTTKPTRIYCSYDSFLRYMTPDEYMKAMGENGIYGTPGNTWGADVLHVGHQLPGATYDSTAATKTGYCRIRSPISTTNDSVMMTMMIHGYNYSGTKGTTDGGHWCIAVSGYGYSTENWSNTSARIVTGSPPFDTVRFGEDETGDYKYILLGESTTDWNYPKVFITDFTAGHSTQTAWFGDWQIDFSASLPSNWSEDGTSSPIYVGGQIRWDGETGTHANNKSLGGRITISTSAASGGQDGDIHFKY